MLEQITAEGNRIVFGQTEFSCNVMPKRTAWRLMDRFRVVLGGEELSIREMMARAQAGTFTTNDMFQLLMDFLSGLKAEFVEDVQATLFRHCEFRKVTENQFMALHEMLEEAAFADMAVFDLYLLMARCIWVNYKMDIQKAQRYFAEADRRKQDEEAKKTQEESAETPVAEGHTPEGPAARLPQVRTIE